MGKSSGCTDQAKSTRHAPVEPAKEPVEGEIWSDESMQILKSPPSILRLEFVTESQKAKLVVKVAHTALKQMGQTAALQACFNL